MRTMTVVLGACCHHLPLFVLLRYRITWAQAIWLDCSHCSNSRKSLTAMTRRPDARQASSALAVGTLNVGSAAGAINTAGSTP
jgi:predicted MFS family arabinose efflux permease